ncbi:pyruvate carboxylase [Candidatus Poriferisodalis sp.]|uniref:pyruvate carboxylase n=1 Tax=Candidatus Poriferisodalis sp. TaxID=3101277 RepID=UPI003B0245ED
MKKLLVANRGEIAIRAFRAATQLGIRTVAILPVEEERSGALHRIKADEAYVIGEEGRPVRAYLDHEAIVATAVEVGADAIYPGYGFLSESPALADACAAAGVTFVGPSAEVLRLTGNKMRARRAAEEAGLPVLTQSAPVDDGAAQADIVAAAAEIGFPLFVKAASGGGGRGMRRVERPDDLSEAVEAARREAHSAFGDGTVFLEEAMSDVRHIEAQVLADAGGHVVHLFERDCSVQRRFQKVVEMAPARDLDPVTRQRLLADAVRFAQGIGYENAGTVEFLVETAAHGTTVGTRHSERASREDSRAEVARRHVFIEMNPRIQVEHTVTEEVTDIDLVESQLRIASGATLADLGLSQERISLRGVAMQCRVTAENPANDFRPDTGRIVAYRPASGAGVRLDGCVYQGVEITPHFDSMIEKITCRGPDFDTVVRRMQRTLAEYRVRGVSTNQPYLQAILADSQFRAGPVTTTFIDDRPELTAASVGADRATRLLRYLADVTVHQPHGPAPTDVDPATKLGVTPRTPPAGSRQRLDELGPAGFAADLRAADAVAVTDTTLRDAHQSILATRLRTIDLVAGARQMAHDMAQLLSIECWGGATFDVALRFLHEDPWERLRRIRAAVPNICTQMLLRGRNTVGYSPYPDTVAHEFVAEAAACGMDIFRVFDAFNSIDQMQPAIEAVIDAGAVAEGTICYSGNLTSPEEDLYTLDYYLEVAEQLDGAGAHILCIKDMAGLLRPPAATTLVSALRDRFPQPVHLHTHDTGGGQLATYLAAIESGVDAIDGAAPPLSGMTSQPSIASIVAMTDNTERATGLSLDAIGDMEPYWEAVRRVYAPFEAGLPSPTGTVYRHEIPGGQLSNLRAQAKALGIGHRFEEVERLYAACNELLGRPIKVTPSSKVVGDLALHMVASGVTPDELAADPAAADLPDSVIGFLHGELGTPPGGWVEPFRSRATEGRDWEPKTSDLSDDDIAGLAGDRAGTLNRLLFPTPSAAQAENSERYGDLSVLPSLLFWYGLDPHADDTAVALGPGVRLLLGLRSISEPNDEGIRMVSFRVNGQPRDIDTLDRTVAADSPTHARADSSVPGHVAAPFRGSVNVSVAEGDLVSTGEVIAVIEAMKMESSISAPVTGTVVAIAAAPGALLEPGDLIAEIRPAGRSGSPETEHDT